ncbi:small, acid-soluble spore protein, alpha/beta type [Sulfoacidibacillus thermotolerans]|uniref:Alpha/beta hydrolase n=1 Tax=Sulfoacidibacillus thermotolerans TaxID=1765684 RepID=A0A2U3D7D9_SULT2|nr:small, acid-soluble spore protein, alpha/beta type [Sulfoacidibacillus thermotolerans]PWI57181.1 hypothetical protein BM613_09950 [Sulfoacidibacillus thermotolerans]
MGRHNRLLIPEARTAMAELKKEVVREVSSVQSIEKRHEVEVDQPMTTHDAGKLGGAIGGEMMKRLIELAQQELTGTITSSDK